MERIIPINPNHGTNAPIYYREDDGRGTESARTVSEAQGMASSAAADLPAGGRLRLRKQLCGPGEGSGVLRVAVVLSRPHDADRDSGSGQRAIGFQDALEPDLRSG